MRQAWHVRRRLRCSFCSVTGLPSLGLASGLGFWVWLLGWASGLGFWVGLLGLASGLGSLHLTLPAPCGFACAQVWAGSPAKFLRNLEPEEKEFITKSACNYAQLADVHRCMSLLSPWEGIRAR